MSIVTSFDTSTEPILKPEHLSHPIDNFPEIVICTFTRYMLNTVLLHFPCVSIGAMFDGRTIYKTTYNNTPIAFFRTSIGAPPTVAFLEEAIAKGAKKILIFGSCGTLDSALTGSNIVVPTHAYRDEGTSYHYAPAEAGDFIEVKSSGKMEAILKDIGVPVVTGKTWTTDALYRETRKNMELRKADGCITVEMECASVMAMADFRGVEAYQFLYTSDNLDAAEWERHTLWSMEGDMLEKLAKTALEAATKL